MKILLVEDDEPLIAVLTKSLTALHYVVDVVNDGEMGWNYGSTFEYDLMVLDVMLPKLDGVSLCQRFRSHGDTTPILLLTAQDSSTARVQGLDAGADDYVVKPFDRAELIARIRALLRRGSTNPFTSLVWGDLVLNTSTCEVTYNGQPLTLTAKEYELLELLLRDSQRVYSTDEILDRLWSSEEYPSEATVRSHVRRLRQKLAVAGAPHDLIATVHGRGYFLKALENSSTLPAATVQKSAPELCLTSVVSERFSDRRLDSQQQYLAFLNQTWTTTKPNSLNQVAMLAQTVRALHVNPLTVQQQTEAHQVAHKLAGNLGMFGLTHAMQLARQLESWLIGDAPPQSGDAALMEALAIELHQEIDNATAIQLCQLPNGHSPLLLIMDSDPNFSQSLEAIAKTRGIQTAIATTIAETEAWLRSAPRPSCSDQDPAAILLRLPLMPTQVNANGKTTVLETEPVSLVQKFAQRYPAVPILVISDRSELSDRLKIAQWGGKLLLESSAAPEQVIIALTQLLRKSHTPANVMVVDDDLDWLATLPTLLKPWGFNITTLADPQQFWTVLQTVLPDVLVLDVNMPQINGFELCQILRSDPQWQRLPVLFLSVRTDFNSQNQAFTVGADDYLCKPVVGVDLANRILHRLQRVQAWSS
ncbi:MAG: response regulator [Leptolyngbyaceae cyanobacterium RU_5_1]|nr:response regulator [Leptolyngbyaceae cyanobacterium RU_5_1]